MNVDQHYEIESDKTQFIQFVDMADEFYTTRFSDVLLHDEHYNRYLYRLDNYGHDDSRPAFESFRYSTFTSFFRTNQIDTPRCFTRTHSVRRRINENKPLKFVNYFMRHGKRNSELKQFNVAYDRMFFVTRNSVFREKTAYVS